MKVRMVKRRRLVVAAVVVAVMAVGAGGLVVVRQQKVAAEMAASREAGLLLLSDGDFERARHKIGPYLNYVDRNDPEALYAYARATEGVELPGNRQFGEAVAFYRQYLEKFPQGGSADAARDRMVGLYASLGAWDEVRRSTAELADLRRLPADARPGMLDRLRLRGLALAATGDASAARPALDAYLRRRPDDVDAHILVLTLARDAGADAEVRRQADERLAELRQRLGDEHPRVLTLLAADAALRGQLDEARRHARRAAASLLASGLPRAAGDDADVAVDEVDRFVRRFVALLDGLQEPALATDVVASIADRLDDASVRLLAANRLARGGRFDALLRLTDDVGAMGAGELLGLRGVALVETGQDDAADALLAVLAGRDEGSTGRAWAGVVGVWQPTAARLTPVAIAAAADPPDMSPEARLKAADAALAAYGHPYFHLLRGEALFDAGEPGVALRSAGLAASAGGGGGPWLRALTTTIFAASASGENAAAGQTMRALLQAFPADPHAAAALGLLLAAAGNESQALEAMQGADASTATVGLVLAVLGRGDVPPDAAELPVRLLLSAAAVAARDGHPSAAKLAAMINRHPDATPVQKVAAEAAVKPEPDAVLALLASLPDDAASLPVRLALLATHDRDAAASLARTAFGDPAVSLAAGRVVWGSGVLNPSDPQDWRALRVGANALTGRLNKIDTEWTTRLARLDLFRPERDADAATLRSHATEVGRVTREYPRHRDGWLVLINLLDRLDLDELLEDRLAAAIAQRPEDVIFRLELADRRISGGGDAGALLDELAEFTESLSDDERRRLASLFERSGRDAQAAAVLPGGSAGAADRLRMAARAGEVARSDLEAAVASGDATLILLAAELFARKGEGDAAFAALDGLPGDEPVVLQTRARVLAVLGRTGEADALLADAVTRTPGDEGLWRLRVLLGLGTGSLDEAANRAREAAASVGPAPAAIFTAFAGAADAVAAVDGVVGDEVGLLLSDVLASPDADVAGALAGAVKAVVAAARAEPADAQTDGRAAQVADVLHKAADEATHSRALQRLATRVDLEAGNTERAVARAERLAREDRRDPEAARLLIDARAAAGQTQEALAATDNWRDRLRRSGGSAGGLLLADVTAARLQIMLGEPAQASQLLRPHVRRSDAAPGVRLLDAQARIAANDPAGALAVLGGAAMPAAESGLRPAWLDAARRAALAGNRDGVRALGLAASDTVASGAMGDLVAVGQVLAMVVQQVQTDAATRAALLSVVDRLEQLGAADADYRVLEHLGMLAGAAGRQELAIASYRSALAEDDSLVIARNNLAVLLVEEAGRSSPPDARRLREEARLLVEPLIASPEVRRSAAFAAVLDTRASVAEAEGDVAAALGFIAEAVKIQPDEPEWLVHQAEVSVRSGDAIGGRRALRQAERVAGQNVPQAVQTRMNQVRRSLDTLEQRP